MCGVTGILDTARATSDPTLRQSIASMTAVLEHRGPDARDVFVDAAAGVALGHRRLSIVDLTGAGAQPMVSADGRYVISFNGEIYNFPALRAELEAEGHRFRGHCDTEVLLEAIAAWGLAAALQRANGMFALILWDRREHTMSLARDRLGEKPLYYGWSGALFLCGSELKSLQRHPRFDAAVDRSALALYLRHGYVPAPYSIYVGVAKVEPGSIVTVRGRGAVEVERYWDPWAVAIDDGATPDRPDNDLLEQLDELLLDAVRMRMHADVPLGAFLSGGVDSSLVCALLQSAASEPVKTFTIGFHEAGFDEAVYAREVALHLGTDHTELYLTAQDALDVVPYLPTVYDEPFADSSQIPTYLVSKLARQSVKVALSGDGGDELFGGYERYERALRLWRAVGWLPARSRLALARTIGRIPPTVWSRLEWLPGKRLRQGKSLGDAAPKVATMLASRDRRELYSHVVTHWKEPTQVVRGSGELLTPVTDARRWPLVPTFEDHMMFTDAVTYLPDDVLVKVDRASMAVSLEARVPLLDHRVVELAWRVPAAVKFRDGRGKWPLRALLERRVPRPLIDRPKMGFGIPLADWLRGPLHEWADDLLDERRLRDEGYFDAATIRQYWTEHVRGDRAWHHYLWDVLMFQAWLGAQRDAATMADPEPSTSP